jgi:putative hydrolase of the HAD superfamily
MYDNIKIIAFDADDTLWINETYFREAESEFAELMQPYETISSIEQELYKIEIRNLSIYGYGIKGFILSMLETAIVLSDSQVQQETINAILNIGKSMLAKPVELLDGVENVLQNLSKQHRLVMVTKGDLIDQERKLQKSGLMKYFHHIEIVSDKKEQNYQQLLQHLDICPAEFLMIGNSLKSDILPVVNIGALAIHIPFHTTWQHENINLSELHVDSYHTINSIGNLLTLLKKLTILN